MSETTKQPKPVRYQLKRGHVLELRGFPYPITNELLAGPVADKHIHAIQNFERENPGVTVLGELIVLK